MKKQTKLLLSLLLLVLIAVLLLLALRQQRKSDAETIVGAGTSEHAVQVISYLEHDGTRYPLKPHLETVLVLGTDNFNREDDVSELFYNYQQADFQTVLIFDTDAKTCTPLQLNRDTMCDVPWLSVNGMVGGTKFCQIALSHTYGSGREDSCENSVRAVRSLLSDAPVEHYAAFTMDAVGVLNDLVGGVTVTVPDNSIAYADPDFIAGNRVHLEGERALRFVRTRDVGLDASNLDRMARQQAYLEGFLTAARERTAEEDFFLRAAEQLDPYMVTDLTVNEMSELVKMLTEYEILPVVTPKGELKLGTVFAEYYVDHDDLWELVRSAYCR